MEWASFAYETGPFHFGLVVTRKESFLLVLKDGDCYRDSILQSLGQGFLTGCKLQMLSQDLCDRRLTVGC
uniref:Uncharacterized protein n=1 Tax=Timema bartmani TaxID=61472 RepID=A0A7R9I391_9NEOP|nr:unnamed protein product [Timema bartmani]